MLSYETVHIKVGQEIWIVIDVFAEDKDFFLFVLCGKRMLIDSLLVTNSEATFMHSSRITSNTYNSVALQSKQLEQRIQSWMQWIIWYLWGSAVSCRGWDFLNRGWDLWKVHGTRLSEFCKSLISTHAGQMLDELCVPPFPRASVHWLSVCILYLLL